MAKILIVYHSDYGSTAKAAQKVADGVESTNNSALLKKAEEATAADVLGSDALVLGSPVHMGSCDWRIKKFIDTVCSSLWMKDQFVGRVGAVFATGGGFGKAGGGVEIALLSMLNNLVELGLIIVPLPKNTGGYSESGLQWGPCTRTTNDEMKPIELTEQKLTTFFKHGANIARLTEKLKGASIFSA